MRHLRVLIVAADDLTAELLTEVAAFDLPLPAITTLQPATALDELETTVFTTGQAILRRLLEVAWETIDAAVAAAYRQQHPAEAVMADGHEPLTVASRFGRLHLRRQVLTHGPTPTTCCLAMPSCPSMKACSSPAGCRSGRVCCPRTCPLPRSHDCSGCLGCERVINRRMLSLLTAAA